MPRSLSRTLVGLAAALAAVAAALAYAARQVQRPAKGNPAEFLRHGRSTPSQRVVVCLGASIVHGRVSVDFVELLRRRFPPEAYAFVNAGVNGDVSYNILRRLEPVIACDPDAVVILAGTNDVQSTLSERVRQRIMRAFKLPQPPGRPAYRENMWAIVTQLRSRTHAAIAWAALPVLGEDLAAPANVAIREFNAAIREVCTELGIAYLPVYERQAEYLQAHNGGHGRPFAEDPGLMIGAALRHFLLGHRLDRISTHNGLLLTTDLIHMNSQGAAIIASQIEDFLKASLTGAAA